MIHVLSGKLISKTPNDLVISCGGVGFYVMIPSSVYAALPQSGQEATVYTYLNVKEDGLEPVSYTHLAPHIQLAAESPVFPLSE